MTTLDSPNRLREVAALFLKLGLFAFGGPAAHIAMMREEVVRRRRWLEDQEFLDMVGATNLIPGPNSTELAIHLGHRRAGWKGLFAAGGLFIIPAVLIVLVIAFLYVEYGTTPAFEWALYGIKPVVIAIILKALLGLGKTALKGPLTAVIGGGVLAGYLLGVNELLLLASAGALAVAARFGGQIGGGSAAALALPAAFPLLGGLSAGAASFSMVTLFLNFLKVGAVLYGSGYVLLAYLRGRLRGASRLADRDPTARRHLRRPVDLPAPSSPPQPSSATWSMGGRRRSWPRWPSSCRRSSSSLH